MPLLVELVGNVISVWGGIFVLVVNSKLYYEPFQCKINVSHIVCFTSNLMYPVIIPGEIIYQPNTYLGATELIQKSQLTTFYIPIFGNYTEILQNKLLTK